MQPVTCNKSSCWFRRFERPPYSCVKQVFRLRFGCTAIPIYQQVNFGDQFPLAPLSAESTQPKGCIALASAGAAGGNEAQGATAGDPPKRPKIGVPSWGPYHHGSHYLGVLKRFRDLGCCNLLQRGLQVFEEQRERFCFPVLLTALGPWEVAIL